MECFLRDKKVLFIKNKITLIKTNKLTDKLTRERNNLSKSEVKLVAGLIEVLIDTLEEENEKYETLLEMSKEKTGTIIKGDLEALQNIIEKEQGVVEAIQSLEKTRVETINDIGNVINRPPRDLTITKLIELMANQPETKERLAQVHDKLKTTMNQMIKVNDMNKGLINESLEMVEFEMNLIHSLRQAPVTANYNKDANNANVRSSGRGMFDTKQ